jgi:hypothetical protein
LKPETPESERLKTDILKPKYPQKETETPVISLDIIQPTHHQYGLTNYQPTYKPNEIYPENQPTEKYELETHRRVNSTMPKESQQIPHLQHSIMDHNSVIEEEKPSCIGCHIVFDSYEGLFMHRAWCIKRKRNEDDDSDALVDMVEEAMEGNNSDWENLYEKYKDRGEDRAIKRANLEILSDDLYSFKEVYSNFLAGVFNYNKSKLHRGIVEGIEELLCDDIPIETAIEKILEEKTSDITAFIKSYRREFEDDESDMSEEDNP